MENKQQFKKKIRIRLLASCNLSALAAINEKGGNFPAILGNCRPSKKRGNFDALSIHRCFCFSFLLLEVEERKRAAVLSNFRFGTGRGHFKSESTETSLTKFH